LPRSSSVIILCMITQAIITYQKHLLIPKSSWFSYNSKLDLQNHKCLLYIFPSGRMYIMKITRFLTFEFDNRLHKDPPSRIDTVGKKASVVVIAAVCFKLHLRTSIQCYMCHEWGSLKNVDIIARTGHPKKMHIKSKSHGQPRLQE
jgi:hypothetical protein